MSREEFAVEKKGTKYAIRFNGQIHPSQFSKSKQHGGVLDYATVRNYSMDHERKLQLDVYAMRHSLKDLEEKTVKTQQKCETGKRPKDVETCKQDMQKILKLREQIANAVDFMIRIYVYNNKPIYLQEYLLTGEYDEFSEFVTSKIPTDQTFVDKLNYYYTKNPNVPPPPRYVQFVLHRKYKANENEQHHSNWINREFNSQELVDLIKACESDKKTFTGDGVTTPFLTTHNSTSGYLFTVVQDYGDIMLLRDIQIRSRPVDRWVLKSKSNFIKNNHIFMWLEDGRLKSGEFTLEKIGDTYRYAQAPSYFSMYLGAGSFGSVTRISIREVAGIVKDYAVKQFEDSKVYKQELNSVNLVVSKLKEAENITTFGADLADYICALDQTSDEAKKIRAFVNSRSADKKNYIVLKSIAYDEKTFCRPVKSKTMERFVATLLRICAFFVANGVNYLDWKSENVVWNDKQVMLVDIVVDQEPTLYIYYKSVHHMNGFIYNKDAEKLLYEKHPIMQLYGVHNTCIELFETATEFTKTGQEYDTYGDTYVDKVKKYIKNRPHNGKEMGINLLRIARDLSGGGKKKK